MAEEKITWRSFYDGPHGGQICEAWHIRALPTVYLIDPNGIVWCKIEGGEGIEAAIDTLLAQVK
jgi:hypothetical protein